MNDQHPTDAPRARLSIAGREPIDVTGPITIGRAPRPTTATASTVEVEGDPLVSKSHFAVDLDHESNGLVITDLESSNGTFIHDSSGETTVPNDRWVSLPNGSEIEFGDQRVHVALLDRGSIDSNDATVVEEATSDSTPVHAVPPIAPADPWGAAADDAVDDGVDDAAPADPVGVACSNCRHQLPGDARFCDECGTPTAVAGGVPGAAATLPPSAPPHQPAPPPIQQPIQHASPPFAAAPGDLGSPTFVDPGPPVEASSGAGKKVALGIGVLVVVGVAVFGVTQLLGGGDNSSSVGLPVIADEIDEQWSESVDGIPIDASVDSGSAYVMVQDDRDAELVRFSLSDGEEEWSQRLGESDSTSTVAGEFGDVVVATVCGNGCEVVGLDRSNGDELWRESTDSDASVVRSGDNVAMVGTDRVTLLDAANGDRIERINADFILVNGDYFLTSDTQDVEVFDLNLEPVYGPVEVPEDTNTGVFDGENMIFGVEGDLLTIDTDGEVLAESRLGVDFIFELAVVDSNTLIVTTDEGVLAVDPVDGRADELWSDDGSTAAVVFADGGAVVLVSQSGSGDATVYDAVTGDRRFDIDNMESGATTVIEGRNAVIVADRTDVIDGTVEVSAIEWSSGDELWDDQFDGLVEAGNDGIVVAGENGDVTFFS